jgi:hypothetical protein
VWNQTRDLNANAKYIIHDAIGDNDGHLTQVIDGRNVETHYEHDSRGREINKREAFGTAIEARTQTIYDVVGNVAEVRSPRYFDSNDTNGLNKAREQWTYNGRNLVATHVEAAGTSEAGTESFTYDLLGKQATHTTSAATSVPVDSLLILLIFPVDSCLRIAPGECSRIPLHTECI